MVRILCLMIAGRLVPSLFQLALNPSGKAVGYGCHRQSHLRAVDEPATPEPMFDRRRARLREKEFRKVADHTPRGQRAGYLSPLRSKVPTVAKARVST